MFTTHKWQMLGKTTINTEVAVAAKIQHLIILRIQGQPSIPGALQLSTKEATGGYRWINATSGKSIPP